MARDCDKVIEMKRRCGEEEEEEEKVTVLSNSNPVYHRRANDTIACVLFCSPIAVLFPGWIDPGTAIDLASYVAEFCVYNKQEPVKTLSTWFSLAACCKRTWDHCDSIIKNQDTALIDLLHVAISTDLDGRDNRHDPGNLAELIEYNFLRFAALDYTHYELIDKAMNLRGKKLLPFVLEDKRAVVMRQHKHISTAKSKRHGKISLLFPAFESIGFKSCVETEYKRYLTFAYIMLESKVVHFYRPLAAFVELYPAFFSHAKLEASCSNKYLILDQALAGSYPFQCIDKHTNQLRTDFILQIEDITKGLLLDNLVTYKNHYNISSIPPHHIRRLFLARSTTVFAPEDCKFTNVDLSTLLYVHNRNIEAWKVITCCISEFKTLYESHREQSIFINNIKKEVKKGC